MDGPSQQSASSSGANGAGGSGRSGGYVPPVPVDLLSSAASGPASDTPQQQQQQQQQHVHWTSSTVHGGASVSDAASALSGGGCSTSLNSTSLNSTSLTSPSITSRQSSMEMGMGQMACPAAECLSGYDVGSDDGMNGGGGNLGASNDRHHRDDRDDDDDRHTVHTKSSHAFSVASTVMSHMTDVTDYEAMERNYRESSVCTEAIERRGLKDPIGFVVICSVVLLGGMSRGVTFPTLWLFVSSLGGTTVTMGYCIAAFSFGRVVTSPIFGHLSVSMGYRWTLLVAGCFLLLGSVLYAQAQIVGRSEFLIVAQTVLGIGSGTLAVTRAYVAEVTPKGMRTTYLSYLAATRQAGFAITPLIVVPISAYFESHPIERLGGLFVVNMYTAPAYLLMLASALNVVAVLFLLTHRRREVMPKITKKVTAKAKAAEREAGLPPAVALGQQLAFPHLCPNSSLTVIDATLWFVVLLNMISKGCTVTYETLGVQLAEEEFNVDSATVGVTMGCAGVLGICILLSHRFLRRHILDVQMIVGGFLVTFLGIVSLTDFGGGGSMGLPRFVLGFVFIYGIGFPVSDNCIVGLFSNVAGNKPQGTLQGVLASSSALSRMLVPLLASYVSQYTSMSAFFIAMNVVLFLSSVIVFGYRNLLTILSSS